MSYEWLGNKYKPIRYSKEIDEKFPYVKYTVPYKDPLFALVKIDDTSIHIEGVKRLFVGPSPKKFGCPYRPENKRTIPEIVTRNIDLTN
jgi:hypothetical protein